MNNKTSLNETLVTAIDDMTNQFIAEGGYITCELSIGEEHVISMHEYIQKKNRDLPDYGMWRLFRCETCESYHADKPYHVEIQVVGDRGEMKEDAS